jgi:hypothetical protein
MRTRKQDLPVCQQRVVTANWRHRGQETAFRKQALFIKAVRFAGRQ